MGRILTNYSNEAWKTVVEELNSDIYSGLNQNDCQRRRKEYGANVINFANDYNGIKIYLKVFLKIYFFIGIGVIAFSIYLNNILVMLVSAISLLLNIVIRLLEVKGKKKKLAALQKLNHTTTTVLRNNAEKIVNCEELVKGDIVIVKKGSLVAADLRIIEANSLKVNEKSLTGESFYKDKFESMIEGRIDDISQMKNMLFKGSLITEGEGLGIVVETGDNTYIGKMMAMITYSDKNKHILEDKIEKKYNYLLLLLTFITVIPFLFSVGSGQLYSNLLLALAIVQSVPVKLILLIYFRSLKSKLKKDYGIELINISTLQMVRDIEFMFLDKIGSLTKEKMTLEYIYSNNITYKKDEIDYNNDINIQRIFDIVLLCNNATYNVVDNTGKGDLAEVAFLKTAARNKIYKSILDGKYPRVFEVPMDSDKRILTTVNNYKRGYRANIRGNVDVVLDRCKYVMVDGVEKELNDEDRDRIRAIDYNFSVDGLITQGVAYRNFNYQPSPSENIESNLVFVGIVALDNPFIDGIEQRMFNFIENGINPILFTEDNRIVAVNLGKRANLISDIGGVISGVEMSTVSEEEFKSIVSKTRIYSRVTPSIKSKVIGMYIRDNYNVVVSGETLGDLPVLSMAKVGISKGNAPEIVKNTSDIFIKEDYLNKFIKIFEANGVFFRQMSRFTAFMLSSIIAQLLLISFSRFINPESIIKDYTLLFSNIILLLFASILTFNSDNDVKYKSKYIIRSILFAGIPLCGTYLLPNAVNETIIFLFGGLIIIHAIIEGKVSFFKISKKFLLGVVLIFVWIIFFSVVAFIDNIVLNGTSFIYLGGSLVLYLLIELLMKRWK